MKCARAQALHSYSLLKRRRICVNIVSVLQMGTLNVGSEWIAEYLAPIKQRNASSFTHPLRPAGLKKTPEKIITMLSFQ